MNYQTELDFAKDLAKQAGEVMKRYFRAADINTTFKSDSTPITIADTKINDLVIAEIKKRFPDHAVLGEEESFDRQSDYVWICDPIDGTLPYSIGIPISTFNLALVHKGQSLVAVQYDPFTDRLYWATKGDGTFLNGEKLKMTDKFPGRLVVDCEIYTKEYDSIFNVFDDKSAETTIQSALRKQNFVLMKMISISNSIGLVASGHLAASVFSNSHTFEAATGSLLIVEAGGKFTSLLGEVERYDQPIKGFIAASPAVHQQILEIVKPLTEGYLNAHSGY